jgi:hypothetical protein
LRGKEAFYAGMDFCLTNAIYHELKKENLSTKPANESQGLK